MKNSVLVMILLISNQVAFTQAYDSYLQLDSKQYNPIITDYARLPNNNMVYSVILNDSAKAMPANTNFYNETVVKNPGSGVLVMSPNNTVVWSYSWMPVHYLNDFFYINALMTDDMGNIYLSGRYRGLVDVDPTNGVQMFQQTNANDVEGFLIKLNAAGNFLWAKKFGNTNIAGMYCDLYTGQFKPNGDLIYSGNFRMSVDFDPGPSSQIVNANSYNNNTFFLTLDTAGNYVDVRTLQIDSSASMGNLSIDSIGNYYAIYYYSGTIDVDMGPGVTNYTLQSGYANACMAKYDSNFGLLWSKNFGEKMISLKTHIKNNQEFYLFSGFKDTIQLNNNTTAVASGYSDFFVEKWNANGNCLWSKTMGGPGADDIYDVAFHNNNLYYLYSYTDSINTNTGANDTTLYASKSDMALSLLTENGMHISSAEVKSDSFVYAGWTKLRLYNNEIYFNFSSNGISDLNPGPATQNVSATWTAPYTTIVVKWKSTPTSLQDITAKEANKIRIWPNPSRDKFNIETPADGTICIYNYSGILIHQIKTTDALSSVSFESNAQGIYYLVFTPSDKNDQVLTSTLVFQQ